MTTTTPRRGRLPHDRDAYLATVSLVRQRRGTTFTVRLFLNRVLREDWSPRRVHVVYHPLTRFLLLVSADTGLTVNHTHFGTATITLSGLYGRHHLPRIAGRLPTIRLLPGGVLAVGPLPREGEQLAHMSNGGRVGCQQQREGQ